MKVGLVYDPVYLEHDTGDHVENSRRLVEAMSYLKETGIKEKLTCLPARPATLEELEMIHAPEYISYVKGKAEKGGGWLDPDTVMSPKSYEAALCAAGGLMVAVEAVMKGEADSAFALVRPPGHHAIKDRAMGFCIFNNVAIAAKFAMRKFSLDRVLIADFDVHHGNGTQDAFYADRKVLYFSTHQYPFYPGTGWMDETGTGEGEGTTVNFPMAGGWGDEEYLRAFNEVLVPAARRFQPQLVLVSAGFDAHWADHLAMMKVSVTGFVQMATILKELAAELCQGRLVFTLEGGYNLRVVASSIKAMFAVLLGNSEIDDPLGKAPVARKPDGFDEHIEAIKRIHHIG
ncbi:MAG: histone deacetylase [Dehalococcoidia bacterium]|nr:histone deacetylase [Dehalococcoidia bacterium]MDH4299112.1 histone deacetylase [Dehalococcoidia bacterium]